MLKPLKVAQESAPKTALIPSTCSAAACTRSSDSPTRASAVDSSPWARVTGSRWVISITRVDMRSISSRKAALRAANGRRRE